MADLQRKKQLEARLSLKQRKAAELLVQKDLSDNLDTVLTEDEIAAQCEIARMTLYRWKNQNASFREYLNILADEYFEVKRSYVYKQLLKTIEGENPSIKGLDLYMRRFGLLTEKPDINIHIDAGSGKADLEASIKEVDDLLIGDLEDFEVIEEEKKSLLTGVSPEEIEELLREDKED